MSIIKNKNYLEITYSEDIAPKTSYPDKLSCWIKTNIFKKEGRLIDLGCGRGDYLDSFKKLGYSVRGLDASPNIENLAREHSVAFIDFEKNIIPEKEKYDFVFSKSVIEHLKEPDNLFSMAYEGVSANGTAVIMTPSWEYNHWGPFYIDHTHVTPFTKTSLKNALHMAGFKDVKVQYFYQLPFLWKYPFLKPLVKILQFLPLPYSPYNDISLPPRINKLIRFSKEVMLLAVAKK
jgi:2-polyprenyl-3-methyl-5-hydroxy-6-metoxy-1,4-benzoquinol methylase